MRLIDADELKSIFDKYCIAYGKKFGGFGADIEKLVEKHSKHVKAEPVRHGRNITTQHPVDEFVCSECKIHLKDYVRVEDYEDTGDITHHEYEIKYCPECGAKMEEDEND